MTAAAKLLVPLALVLAGCADTVAFTTTNLLGIELDAVDKNQAVRVGRQREEFVYMPGEREPEVDEQKNVTAKEVYTVIAADQTEATGFLLAELGTVKVSQRFATGRAAKQALAASSVAAASGAPLADVLNSNAAQTALRAEFDTLVKRQLKDDFASAGRTAGMYADERAAEIKPGSTSLQLRAAGGENLLKLNRKLKEAVQGN